jgi:cell division protein FtsI/penicillin-binding protein 2
MVEIRTDVRARVVAILVGCLGIIFLARLFQIQVIRGEEFREMAGSQYLASRLHGLYDRGSIFAEDRGGRRLTVAGLDSGYTFAVNPQLLADVDETYTSIAAYLPDLAKEDFMERARNEADPYEEVRRRVDGPTANKLSSLGLDGVILAKERWRYYPGQEFASNVLGFVGWRENTLAGRYGLESYYEDILARGPSDVYKNFFSQMFSNLHDEVFGRDEVVAGDLVLTLEPKVESLAESKANALVEKWGAKQAGIVVIDPKTGDILAMAQAPSFNPNKYSEESDVAVYKNSFVEDVFEMGSIMKPISMAAAIDAEVVDRETKYFDSGFVELDGKRIENFDGKGRGRVDMQEVLSQSLNTGAVFAALALGREAFREYMYRFGFQDKTEIDLPGEVANLVANLESNKDVELATASFGQGIAVTPIAMIRALAALGNGGYLIKPRLVKSIERDLAPPENFKITEQGRAIAGETSEEITRMLVRVVDEALLQGEIKMKHYSIAAKTGTAQIASPEGGYYEDRYLHSFFGYFPAYEPRFLVFMFLREPVGVKYASETLARPFRDIAEFLLNYYEVPPDR